VDVLERDELPSRVELTRARQTQLARTRVAAPAG